MYAVFFHFHNENSKTAVNSDEFLNMQTGQEYYKPGYKDQGNRLLVIQL